MVRWLLIEAVYRAVRGIPVLRQHYTGRVPKRTWPLRKLAVRMYGRAQWSRGTHSAFTGKEPRAHPGGRKFTD